jgi:hypothetical protein
MHASIVARPEGGFQVPEVDLCGVPKSADSVECRRCYAVSLSLSLPILAHSSFTPSPFQAIRTSLQGDI